MAVSRFVGVGVGEYDKGHPRLDHAVPDVEAVAGLLEGSFDCTVLRNPVEHEARDCLKGLRDSMPERGGSLVLLWSGHAIPSPADGLRLLARDSGDHMIRRPGGGQRCGRAVRRVGRQPAAADRRHVLFRGGGGRW